MKKIRIEKRNLINDNRAVTAIIGTNLLLLITVAIFSLITVSIFSFMGNEASVPSVDILCQYQADNIILSHDGGDALTLDTKIEIKNENGLSQEFIVQDVLSESYHSDGRWSFGEKIIHQVNELRGTHIEVYVIDAVSNAILLNTRIPPSDPIFTFINDITPFQQTNSPLIISATSTGSNPENVTLWYRWNWFWLDDFTNDDEKVINYNNMDFSQGDFVVVNESCNGTIDYVDDDSSDVDGSSDVGSHSNFNAQKAGPDGTYDTLSEEDTGGSSSIVLIDDESFEGSWPPSGWSETGLWNKEGDEEYDGSYSADFDGDGWGEYGYLYSPVLDCSDATSIYISFYFNEQVDSSNEFQIDFYDGTSWDDIENLGSYPSGWNHWTTTINDPDYFQSDFQIRWYAYDVDGGWWPTFDDENIYLDLVNVTKESGTPNYEMNLEVQWTNVNYSKPNEELCIYLTGTDPEDLTVKVWNESNSQWDELIDSLITGWNNISVSGWLNTSTFTILYEDSDNTSDSNLNSLEIDSTYLKLLDPANECEYNGNITSINITKPDGTNWNTFYADVNNTDDSTFSILDENNTVLKDGLNGNGNSISSISNDTIRLYGIFDGPSKLSSWNVTIDTSGEWTSFGTDTTSGDGWSWDFNFPEGEGYYWFFSIGRKNGWEDEEEPYTFDENCYYKPNGG